MTLEVTSMPWPERPAAVNTGLAGRVLGVLSLNFAGNLGVLSTSLVAGGAWELVPDRKLGRGGFLPQWSKPQQH